MFYLPICTTRPGGRPRHRVPDSHLRPPPTAASRSATPSSGRSIAARTSRCCTTGVHADRPGLRRRIPLHRWRRGAGRLPAVPAGGERGGATAAPSTAGQPSTRCRRRSASTCTQRFARARASTTSATSTGSSSINQNMYQSVRQHARITAACRDVARTSLSGMSAQRDIQRHVESRCYGAHAAADRHVGRDTLGQLPIFASANTESANWSNHRSDGTDRAERSVALTRRLAPSLRVPLTHCRSCGQHLGRRIRTTYFSESLDATRPQVDGTCHAQLRRACDSRSIGPVFSNASGHPEQRDGRAHEARRSSRPFRAARPSSPTRSACPDVDGVRHDRRRRDARHLRLDEPAVGTARPAGERSRARPREILNVERATELLHGCTREPIRPDYQTSYGYRPEQSSRRVADRAPRAATPLDDNDSRWNTTRAATRSKTARLA